MAPEVVRSRYTADGRVRGHGPTRLDPDDKLGNDFLDRYVFG